MKKLLSIAAFVLLVTQFNTIQAAIDDTSVEALLKKLEIQKNFTPEEIKEVEAICAHGPSGKITPDLFKKFQKTAIKHSNHDVVMACF